MQGFRKKYERLSLARKISLLSIMVISFVMISFTMIVRIFYENSVIDIATNGYAQKFEAVSENCMNLFSGAEQLSKVLCTDEDIQNWFDYDKENGMPEYVRRILKAERQLDYVDALYPDDRFSSISIFTEDGDMLNTNNIRSKKDVYQSFFKAIKGHTAGIRWIDLYDLQIDGYEGGGIAFVRPYRDYTTGKVKGYIMVEHNSAMLADNFSELRYGRQGQYLITDREGNVKISSEAVADKVNRSADYNISGEDFFRYAVRELDGDNIYKYEGEKYLVTVAQINTLNWIMIGLTPVNVLTEKGDIMVRLVYAIGFLAMLVSAFFNYYIAHSVTKPLSALAKTMERFGKGELEISVPVDTDDEIGKLSGNFNKMTTQIKHLIGQVYEEQRAKRKYEISVLQAQINPHFLYNTLNSVCSLIKVNKPEEAYSMIYAIGQFYRTALSNGNILIPIEEEISNIRHYIQIQSIRYGNKIDYDIQIEEELYKYYILKLTLQPIIENAIYHGVKELDKTGVIRIEGWKEENTIYFCVKDNGIGMEQKKASVLLKRDRDHKQSSFGLYSIHQRIQLYFGKEYGLNLTSNPGEGVTAVIKIPCVCEREDL